MKRTIIFIAGGALLTWGAICYYMQTKKKQNPGAAGAAGSTGTTTTVPEKTSPARLSNDLAVQENGPQAEMIITDQPVQLAPLSQAVQYFDNNGQYYRPRTTLAIDPQMAQDVITIDSANTYPR